MQQIRAASGRAHALYTHESTSPSSGLAAGLVACEPSARHRSCCLHGAGVCPSNGPCSEEGPATASALPLSTGKACLPALRRSAAPGRRRGSSHDIWPDCRSATSPSHDPLPHAAEKHTSHYLPRDALVLLSRSRS
jgi:hypothetical protein